MLLVDAQQNIAFNAQQLGRDYGLWAWQQRRREGEAPQLSPATTSLRDNLLARVAVVFGSVQVIAESAAPPPRYTWRSQADAQQLARWQVDYYRRLADDNDNIQLILNQSDLAAVLDSWQADKAIEQHKQGIVIALKGGEAIAEPKQCEEWLEYGLRCLAPAWQTSRYAAPAHSDGALSRLGYELLEALASFNALLDIAGMAERAAISAIERYAGAIIASHSSPRYFSDNPRCLSDRAIQSLAEVDGVMGIMVYNGFLKKDWHAQDPKRRVTVAHWVDAVDYVCQLTGSVAHVALGSNIDGGYRYSSLPAEIDSASDLWLLRRALLARGFAEEEAAAILGGNMLRKLRQTLPAG